MHPRSIAIGVDPSTNLGIVTAQKPLPTPARFSDGKGDGAIAADSHFINECDDNPKF